MSEATRKALYATDGTDFRGAVKAYYAAASKRFLRYFAICLPLWLQLFVFKIEWLLPVAIAGFLGVLISTITFYSKVSWIWRCSRVFRAYPLQFRGPVDKVHLGTERKIVIRFGKMGAYDSPMLRAVEPLTHIKAPTGMTAGIWFAGDDPFGGAAIVPGSGELLFMQPREWDSLSQQRRAAGVERAERARRAGLKRRVPVR